MNRGLKQSFPQVVDAVLWAASFLAEKGVENGRLEAELLMAKAMGVNRAWVLGNPREPLPEDAAREFLSLVEKRGRRFPLQYLTGTQEFMSLPFSVEEGVLIPRGDTEVLVESILRLGLPFQNILDVGTGSGIIAVSLARYLPDCKVTALDISSKALALAKRNAKALGVEGKVSFVQADIFYWTPEIEYDLVVSNPPYVTEAEMESLQPEVQFEPHEALYGGEKGLDFYVRLSALAVACLKPGGVLAVEIGWQQGDEVGTLFHQAGFGDIVVVPDYGSRDRVVLCRKSQG